MIIQQNNDKISTMINHKKKEFFYIVAIVVSLCILFTSCGSTPQYGDWVITQTGNPETLKFSDFPYPITITIAKDGNIYLQDDLFGTVEQKRQTYAFTQTVQVGDIEKLLYQEGTWEIKKETDGSVSLYIYPYDEKIIYKLVRLS